jgi:flagellar motor switch protein FliN/FliY
LGCLLADKLSQSEIDAMLREQMQPVETQSKMENNPQKNFPIVEKVNFAPFSPAGKVIDGGKRDLNYFNQIPMIIAGELGKAHLTVRELLELEEGSVIKLDKLAGESATVLINGQYFGLAEIVVINERFGLRITEIGSTEEEQAEK